MLRFSKIIGLSLFAAALSASLSPAQARQDNPTQVIELFTSQGCSSCPLANNMLTEYARDRSILALSYSVEYWDYLGWKDTFASAHFSDRQRAYARAIGHGRVYTPQMVINGAWDKPRVKPKEIKSDHLPNAAPALSLAQSGDIHIECDGSARWDAYAVTFKPGAQQVAVKAGENHGRTVEISNVVTGVIPLAQSESGPQDYMIDVPDGQAYAVILQHPEHGPILSAAVYRP